MACDYCKHKLRGGAASIVRLPGMLPRQARLYALALPLLLRCHALWDEGVGHYLRSLTSRHVVPPPEVRSVLRVARLSRRATRVPTHDIAVGEPHDLSVEGVGRRHICVERASYSIWGFARAIFDPLQRGNSPKALAERGGYLVSGLVYAAFILPTMRIFFGAGGGGTTDEQDWTAWLLSQPYDSWLVGGVGSVAAVGALGQFYIAMSARFKQVPQFAQQMGQ